MAAFLSSHPNFQKKIFWTPKNCKNAYISKTMLDRGILTKFLTRRLSLQSSYANFQKNFVSPKMAAILSFANFSQKLQKKNAYISKTVLDRVISMKFLIRRVSLESCYPNFQKNICLAKNGGHFRIFQKNCKTQKCLYLENRDR